jgi:hypothetical protein
MCTATESGENILDEPLVSKEGGGCNEETMRASNRREGRNLYGSLKWLLSALFRTLPLKEVKSLITLSS